jgi:ABC-type multidrug transport system fused ATPase/permease subunit
LIDMQDISELGLHELRNVVTIIPQDPVLFTGSLRENIDPTGEKLDFDIFKLLKTANLEKYDDLDLEVEEGGANFSQGEKQLVCLVRALCRGSR